MKVLLGLFLMFYSSILFAQEKSDDAIYLEERYVIYKVSETGVDTKSSMKSMKKAILRVSEANDTSAIAALLDIYIGYDATDNDVRDLAFITLIKFKQAVFPRLNKLILEAETKYGNQRNMHTDYMDLCDLKKRIQ